MKISRWIYIPLTTGLLGAILYTLLGFTNSISGFAGLFIVWSLFGFVFQLYSHFKAKRRSGVTGDEKIHSVRQNKNITVLLNFQRTFELCTYALESINPAKIRVEDSEKGILEVRTRMNWNTFGVIVRLELKTIGENLTDVKISARPAQGFVLVDYGESWNLTEKIIDYLKDKDTNANSKILVESADILNDVYVKPFDKNKSTVQNR